ncbi:hypothetical protein IX317_000583 [Fusobacterium sp. DD29]|uniref:ATP-binding cassette domain-containing protein n=1 Tax=unclassified Fusobacterium TaxID=2648384 RepID=UPI001B8D06DD|nr:MULTISPECIES: ATP-binding cassette domain-containing protein [unclassified Fusobacterium]MBR8700678.1 hypothetical protein [Fusobacterium sp. DD45]MBR8710769.1 hypothetical protein [Fusobacterium sp. DD28]MBR8748922.1 hypothetical protein [Fusobacterium sp. DD29]MBR8751377.1 hypothetical protein [Fusobacterium sp. DD26]MBR8761176.1 hypothetical protein [Fusobacterium sp. DD25]
MFFDLHIHSKASEYKEDKEVIKNSTIENIDVLLEKLNEYNVGLFSITDHNRFDNELYKQLDIQIKTNKYPNVKGLVAGIEFDVSLDDKMKSCHIIAIFDAKNKEDNYKKINDVLNKNLLKQQDEAYKKDQFEAILKEIGLNVILIACQRNNLDQHDGRHNSLSESTEEPKEFIKTKYISALEFQKPAVEGILKNNLKTIPVQIGLVTGSDCHEWTEYPNHSKDKKNDNFHHSSAKILPTFKGLLMAITSPETRINQPSNKNTKYIEHFNIQGKKIKLATGINAIIGENGSGKSTLLNLLNDTNSSPKYIKDLIKTNQLVCENQYPGKKLFIGQGDIVTKFQNSELFPKTQFKQIQHENFRSMYKDYASKIYKYIQQKIDQNEATQNLKQKKLAYNSLIEESTYFIQIICDKNYDNIDNPHAEPANKLSNIFNALKLLLEDQYFQQDKEEIEKAIHILNPLLEKIKTKSEKVDIEKNIKNTISSQIANYSLSTTAAASTRDNQQQDYTQEIMEFINNIVSTIVKTTTNPVFPTCPPKISGFTENKLHGFSFNSEAYYHDKNVHDEFLAQMFNKNYSNLKKLQSITTNEEFVSAVTGCTSVNKLSDIYNNNLEKFLNNMCKEQNFIIDVSSENKTLGSTLGEQSLAYFKYITKHENEKCIFLIDQPEDHISNNNISKNLIKYLNSIRYNKQIIIVTHNPLLVVNQDVDQLIFVKNNNNKITITAGCLELEDDETNILDIVAHNMDGGKDSIEKRLRVYG